MTYKEINLKIFQRKEITDILFQPRVEPWFIWQKERNEVPLPYKEMNIFQFYDNLGISMRYFDYWTGLKSAVVTKYSEKIKVVEKEVKDENWVIIETEKGELVRKMQRGGSGNWITSKFPVEEKDDFLKLKNLYENTKFYFSAKNYEEGEKIIGDRGYPQFFLPRSPYQCLWIEWCDFQTLIYGLIFLLL